MGRRLKRYDFDEHLYNYNLIEYFGEIYVGQDKNKPAQIVTAMFDTSSAFTWLDSSLDTDNDNPLHQVNMTNITHESTLINFTAGPNNIEVNAVWAKCNIMVNDGGQTKSNWLAIKHTNGVLSSIADGSMGLSYGSFYPKKLNLTEPNRDGFVRSMDDDSVIDRGVVGIYLSGTVGYNDSEIMIGNYDTDYATNPIDIYWYSVETNLTINPQLFWMAKLTDAKVNGEKVLSHKPRYAYISTSEHSIYIPYFDFLLIFDKLKAAAEKISSNVYCTPKSEVASYCLMDHFSIDDFPKLHIYLGGDNYYLDPQDYVQISETRYLDGRYKVLFKVIGRKDMNNWLLGTPFLRNYYTILDFDQDRFGFFPTQHSINGSYGHYVTYEIIFLIVCYLILLIVGAIVGGRWWARRRKEKINKKQDEEVESGIPEGYESL